MKRCQTLSCLFVGCIAILMLGCDAKKEKADEADEADEADKSAKTHEHDDELVWGKPDLEQDGFKISLGHHGKDFHFGDMIEPAASITKDGSDVADASISCSLVSQDGKDVLAAAVQLEFEPKTPDEPAHYASKKLKIPDGASEFVIRFEIKLPGVDEPRTLDLNQHAHAAH